LPSGICESEEVGSSKGFGPPAPLFGSELLIGAASLKMRKIAKRYDGVYYTEDTVKENVQEAVKGNFEVYQTVVIGHIFARMSGSTDLMGRVSRYLEFNKPKP
jgi:hypothetical protein